MPPNEPVPADDLLSRVRALRRWTVWTAAGGVLIDGDAGHPQGLARWDDSWLVATVHPETARGEVLLVGADGTVHERLDVTDGERFHPGGIDVWPADRHTWTAIAEYRPRSTTLVARLDTTADGTLTSEPAFRFDDHLGAICELADGSLFAVSWGSRRWYRLDTGGRVLAERRNPDHTIDLQDLQRIDDRHVVGTGVGGVLIPTGPLQLGGLVVIDVDEMVPTHITPVTAWMPSGRVATFNGSHLGVDDEQVVLRCVVDDTTAEIARWVV